jgi:hypothetical protein
MVFLADIITMENLFLTAFGNLVVTHGSAIMPPQEIVLWKIPYLPSNHQPNFIPDLEPTLRTGVCALTSAALAYLPATGSVQKTA